MKQPFVCFVLFVVSGVLASAHRLDEYLQAARIGISADRVSLELDLTPGVSVADRIFAAIDGDRDGVLSTAEQQAYTGTVMKSLTLDLDGRSIAMELNNAQFPSREDMREGVGTIRITSTARLPSPAGAHALHFRNLNQPELSVYLANALAPDNPAVEILAQTRDQQQRELRIDYRIGGESQNKLRGLRALRDVPGLSAAAAAASGLTVLALLWIRRAG